MKYNKTLVFIGLIILTGSCSFLKRQEQSFDVNKALTYCDQQIKRAMSDVKDADKMPHYIPDSLDRWQLLPANGNGWTIGFWPGILWYNYENTREEEMKDQAIHFTDLLEYISRQPADSHDIGFQIFCSYGNAYRLTGNESYKKIILATADTLATLFNHRVGTILSWPQERRWPHHTIIDNLMNLEILFWASKNGGSKHLYDIALKHAETTMKNHFRLDGSSYHLIGYDTITGNMIEGVTVQGQANNSVWARGQAWAIYGFTMVYRETQDKRFLRFAEKVTDVFLKRLPEDYVPYWDFDAPNIPDEPKDASASAIVASALIELSQLEDNQEKADEYKRAALNILESLSGSSYQSRKSKPSFLLQSTGFKKRNREVNSSLIYADYYYIEALTRLKKCNLNMQLSH